MRAPFSGALSFFQASKVELNDDPAHVLRTSLSVNKFSRGRPNHPTLVKKRSTERVCQFSSNRSALRDFLLRVLGARLQTLVSAVTAGVCLAARWRFRDSSPGGCCSSHVLIGWLVPQQKDTGWHKLPPMTPTKACGDRVKQVNNKPFNFERAQYQWDAIKRPLAHRSLEI